MERDPWRPSVHCALAVELAPDLSGLETLVGFLLDLEYFVGQAMLKPSDKVEVRDDGNHECAKNDDAGDKDVVGIEALEPAEPEAGYREQYHLR